MTNKLFALNILYTVFDLVVAIAGIALFGGAAWFFGKWWLTIFALLPLSLYNNRSMIISADIEAIQRGGGQDSEEEQRT